MQERTELLLGIASEILGPGLLPEGCAVAMFAEGVFQDSEPNRRGALAWRPEGTDDLQEVLYFDRENPGRKYGIGVLHPSGENPLGVVDSAAAVADTVGVDVAPADEVGSAEPKDDGEDLAEVEPVDRREAVGDDDFEIASPDVRRPSTFGVSFCVRLDETDGSIHVSLPRARVDSWVESGESRQVNGIYEGVARKWIDEKGVNRDGPAFRRKFAVPEECGVIISRSEFISHAVIRKPVDLRGASSLSLRIEAFPRKRASGDWLVTVVLRNCTPAASSGLTEGKLFQAAFDVSVRGGVFVPYPESSRPFDQLDEDERSLALLYSDSTTWAIGHSCAAGWNSGAEGVNRVFSDFLPVVELPSMTPDAVDNEGHPISLRMRDLAELSSDESGPGWSSLESVVDAYSQWIGKQKRDSEKLSASHAKVAAIHIARCEATLERMTSGINLLRSSGACREAFRLSNQAMLLQQIATKQLKRRPLVQEKSGQVRPAGGSLFPDALYGASAEEAKVGRWRAFQIAFLLTQIDDLAGTGQNRDIVDLIWFPTGGGKTEAYLGVLAFQLFHERLRGQDGIRRDGTNAFMRYTLRMLTTQQFQRAASLICAMEKIRREQTTKLPGERFSVGLWIGGDGTPNNIADAKTRLNEYRDGRGSGNPLVLTECPWCRSEIGRHDGAGLKGKSKGVVCGVTISGAEGPLLHCTDASCEFGGPDPSRWLPVEVIDERIYRRPPSLVIATADKFAMMAYRPDAGALFGRTRGAGGRVQEFAPPGLIIQDELHLISGPLGTLYGLYEAVIENLCVAEERGGEIRPKIISSTATIRGASEQIKALYSRLDTAGNVRYAMFPPPGLSMSDSFFGTYARDGSGKLKPGRRYVGIHATEYGSILTTQVRTFSAALREAQRMPSTSRDPWWTLLVFYNSIRELAGAKTLFESDIRSRLKFIQNREGLGPTDRRNLRIVEELTSRLNQAEIVGMMDRLTAEYGSDRTLDACLASSIIEVGVDIDRLSLMGVVGQPKTTAQYIQVTGRVGRRWEDRPGLILMIYNPGKSRDRSHFEQFHTYHRRLYEKVEPTSATPFSPSAVSRGLAGAALLWARQFSDAPVGATSEYLGLVRTAAVMLRDRCKAVQVGEDVARSLDEINRVLADLEKKWKANPQLWEQFPPSPDGEYLMLWPGQFSSAKQRQLGVTVPTSLRQVDGAGELTITQAYAGTEVS